MSDSVAVPRIDGLMDWYYLEGDKIRHVVKIGFRIKLERLFQYESPEDAFEFFQARQRERSEMLRKWGGDDGSGRSDPGGMPGGGGVVCRVRGVPYL